MEHRLKIKVCGLVQPENIQEVCSLAPDFVGYIFYPGSKRYVGMNPDPGIFGIPGKEIAKVGVFVNEDSDQVKRLYDTFQLDMVQLHGSESPSYCKELFDAGLQVIKVVNPEDLDNDKMLAEYQELVQLFLFDTPGTGYGGTGNKFEWDTLAGKIIPLPFMLSGGIGPDDVSSIGEVRHDKLFGVDVNSRFELSAGIKDIGLLKEFISEIRK